VGWLEASAAAGLDRGGLTSRLISVSGGVARVEASEAILAQELTLRSAELLAAANAAMRGRPGATMVLQRVAVSVGRE